MGILFSAIVLALSFYNKPKENLTKDEIIERAKKFGLMTEQEWEKDRISKTLENMGGQTATPDSISDNTGSQGALGGDKTADAGATKKPTQKPKEDTKGTDSPVSMTPSNEPSSEPSNEPDDESKEDEKTPLPSLLAQIVVRGGMVSSEVAEDLERQGIVEDAYDFDQYMCDNGFAPQIQVGTFYVPKGATYLEIAEILMGK